MSKHFRTSVKREQLLVFISVSNTHHYSAVAIGHCSRFYMNTNSWSLFYNYIPQNQHWKLDIRCVQWMDTVLNTLWLSQFFSVVQNVCFYYIILVTYTGFNLPVTYDVKDTEFSAFCSCYKFLPVVLKSVNKSWIGPNHRRRPKLHPPNSKCLEVFQTYPYTLTLVHPFKALLIFLHFHNTEKLLQNTSLESKETMHSSLWSFRHRSTIRVAPVCRHRLWGRTQLETTEWETGKKLVFSKCLELSFFFWDFQGKKNYFA